ncbi:DUF2867 domain-containing protein [Nocardioides dongxiaopingii]|uniref:DUF2867 domain-containing protein n=1 Tax=Nocardioides TaxID=1839 RepID=UPI0010C7685B|nr:MULTISPECIES: DUF2867 domain-containing protein [Nocardioides]QCW52018.1 DUF2867 domain-containing protein [Nocardioides sp. S-1144]
MRRARTLHTSRRDATVRLSPEDTWSVVASGRAGRQWYVDAAPLVFRRAIDRLVLGPGLRRPPPGRPLLATGDRVGFWRVTDADHRARRLALEADVRAPGTVRLEAVVRADEEVEGASTVSVTIGFAPRGVLGHAYLLADLPAREAVTELVVLDVLTILRRHDNPDGSASVDQA